MDSTMVHGEDLHLAFLYLPHLAYEPPRLDNGVTMTGGVISHSCKIWEISHLSAARAECFSSESVISR